jgi:hypothetical protein
VLLVALPILAMACADGDGSDESTADLDRDPSDAPAAPVIVEADPEAVAAAFEERGKLVVTFSGYSGSGYEDEAAMLERARALLAEYDPESTIVNIGATVDGIGAVYEVASGMGFETTGIVSSQAREAQATFSPFADRVYVIPDELWGGRVEGTDRLSPTSEAMVDVSDVFLSIGGGEVTRDELLAARAQGKEVRFFAADLNHQRALDRAERRGEEPPTDFRGAAHGALGEESSG